MSASSPLSIGEVLSVLQEEFPDVTISKIRFLESQGLVRPERNASGYRQFTDTDVERLTWILRQQRDHFLPLKVIKKALERGVDVHDAGEGDQPTLWSAYADAAARDAAAEVARQEGAVAEAPSTAGETVAVASTAEAPKASDERHGGEGDRTDTPRRRHVTPADVVAALQEDPRGADRPPVVAPTRAATRPPERHRVTDDGSVPLTRDELLAAAGIDDDLLAALESFGLVDAVPHAGEPGYSHLDVEVAQVAGLLATHGVEARHLRIYKVAAEREAGFVEQLVTPLLKQRNPAARARARELAAELTSLGARVHAAILSRELGPDVSG